MSDFIFEKIGLDDVPELQRVGHDSYMPYYQEVWHPGGVEWYVEHCFNEATLTDEINSGTIEYYLPRTPEGEVVGLVKVRPLSPIPLDGFPENAYHLEKIYLLPAFFGQGVGQKLIQWVLEQAQSLDRDLVWLNVMHNAATVGAYAKAGFKIVGPVHFGFELLKEEEQDGWVMVKVM